MEYKLVALLAPATNFNRSDIEGLSFKQFESRSAVETTLRAITHPYVEKGVSIEWEPANFELLSLDFFAKEMNTGRYPDWSWVTFVWLNKEIKKQRNPKKKKEDSCPKLTK